VLNHIDLKNILNVSIMSSFLKKDCFEATSATRPSCWIK